MNKPIFLMVKKGHAGVMSPINDDGVWFQGNVDHWAECFFTNTSEEAIKAFAEDHDSYISGSIT